MNDLEKRFEELRQFNKKFNESRDKDTRQETSIFIDSTRNDIEELVADQIYHKLTILFNNTRKNFGIHEGRPKDPIRKYDKRTVIDLGNMITLNQQTMEHKPTYTREQLLILVISMRE